MSTVKRTEQVEKRDEKKHKSVDVKVILRKKKKDSKNLEQKQG